MSHFATNQSCVLADVVNSYCPHQVDPSIYATKGASRSTIVAKKSIVAGLFITTKHPEMLQHPSMVLKRPTSLQPAIGSHTIGRYNRPASEAHYTSCESLICVGAQYCERCNLIHGNIHTLVGRVHVGFADVVGGFHGPPSRQPHTILTHPLLLPRASSCNNHGNNFYRESPKLAPASVGTLLCILVMNDSRARLSRLSRRGYTSWIGLGTVAL
jgi:hypothetical protein